VRMRLATSLIAVRYTAGIRDVVRFGSRIPIVPDSVIRELEEAANRIPDVSCNAVPNEGTSAYIERGPFRGFAGSVLRMNAASERVQLLIELLGHSRVLEIDRDALRM
jgi:transcription antitermination factor NusG